MDDSIMWVILYLVVTTIAGLALLIFILSRVSRRLKNIGGVEGLRQRLQQELKASAPVYPAVSPTPTPGKALGCSMAVLLLMVATMAVGAFVQQREVREVRRLQTEGVVAVARVDDKKVDRDSEDGDTYSIYYTFRAVAPNGATRDYAQWEDVPLAFYNRMPVGATLEVVYVPGAPDINRLRKFYTPGKVRYWGIFIGLGAALPCLALGAGQLTRYRNARRLDDEGMQVTTRVLDHYTHTDSDGNSYYIIYELPGVGRVRQAVTRKVQAQLSPGSPIRLTYLPDNPRIFRMEQELWA
ncbi:MAG: hypothetical protein JXR84_04050 [Anaerolineae bacterium]|nr:hypothetical protein [Anaerolineae bacterium]